MLVATLCLLTHGLLSSEPVVLSGQILVQGWDPSGATGWQALFSSGPPIWLPIRPALNEAAWFPKGNKSKCIPGMVAHRPLILAPRRQRWAYLCEFKASLPGLQNGETLSGDGKEKKKIIPKTQKTKNKTKKLETFQNIAKI